MSYSILFTKLADADILNAINWYNEQQVDLGDEFYNELITSIKKLQTNFVEHQKVFESLRKINLKRFPFQVFYEQIEAQQLIVIVAVFHFKQDIRKIKKRISK